MSGHDLAREPGLGEQRDHRLGEMPLPVQPAQPLIGAKRQRDGPGPSHSVDSPTAAPPPKRVRVSEIEIQTSETIETMEKKERDQSELCAKLQEYRAIARERDEWKKKYEDLQVAYKEDEIKHLKELYMAKVSQVSQEVLATMKSSEGSSDTRPRTRVQELCASRGPEALDLRASRGPENPQQTQPSASSQRNTIPDPSDTYLAPQFQESFNQVARATMDEINRTTGRSLGRIVPSQRRDHSSNSSVPQNPLVGTTVADFMNGNVTRWNEMIRNLVGNNPGELRLLDLENMLRMIDHIALTRCGIHFNIQRGRH